MSKIVKPDPINNPECFTWDAEAKAYKLKPEFETRGPGRPRNSGPSYLEQRNAARLSAVQQRAESILKGEHLVFSTALFDVETTADEIIVRRRK